MKRYVGLFAILLSLNLAAQKRMPPTPEEMHEKKWEHLCAAARLTEEERSAVKPIYLQHEEGVWKLHEKYRSERQGEKEEKLDFEKINEEYIESEVERVKLLQTYHQALKEVLPAEKLFRYYRAEDSHKRELIYEIQDIHRRRDEGRHRPQP